MGFEPFSHYFLSPMKKWIRNNSLSLVFLLFFILSLGGQALTGWKENNKELKEKGHPALGFREYLHSGHFIQATFENWESEFLQMALFVVLTISLYQRGSSVGYSNFINILSVLPCCCSSWLLLQCTCMGASKKRMSNWL